MSTLNVPNNYDVGVIVGRFQTDELTQGHKDLLDHVCSLHSKVLVLVGVAPTANTTSNPLDYEIRANMLMVGYGNQITVGYIKDVHNDELWSEILDGLVQDFLGPRQEAVLYGSRDSFLTGYCGRFDTCELQPNGDSNASARRAKLANEIRSTADFRAGVIWASANRFPVVFTCVDVAIVNPDKNKIALGKKFNESQWRLIGGFADPASFSFEDDAYREVYEETRMGLFGLKYLGSFSVDDWRYAKEVDCIKTLLFLGVTEDIGRAADDIADLQWFDLDKIRSKPELIVDCHQELMARVLEELK